MSERHAHTFSEGDLVAFFPDDIMHREHVGKQFKVRRIRPVEPELIEYDPYTHEGGVGHHQRIQVEGLDGIFSGLWFQPPTA